jgi:hypothetical protein
MLIAIQLLQVTVFHYNYEVHLNKIRKLIAEHESDGVAFLY